MGIELVLTRCDVDAFRGGSGGVLPRECNLGRDGDTFERKRRAESKLPTNHIISTPIWMSTYACEMAEKRR